MLNENVIKPTIRILIIVGLILVNKLLVGQNTIGVVDHSENQSDGIILLAPISDDDVYLIDHCGRILHQWNVIDVRALANYLDDDGNLYRASWASGFASGGGIGGQIDKYNWEGDLQWSIVLANDSIHLHHDFDVLPNGNILVLAYKLYFADQWIKIGAFDVDPNSRFFDEVIMEIEVTNGEPKIVWEWHLTDHVVQDKNPLFPNYGSLLEHSSKIDINISGQTAATDWVHMNSIRYNQATNQILLSSKHLNELFIIEKTKSSKIASQDFGGKYGKGGDFLYRWGNGINYGDNTPENQYLKNQHNIQWINEVQVSIFNNGDFQGSSFLKIELPQLPDSSYEIVQNIFASPEIINDVDQIDQKSFYSGIMSSTQNLSNGHFLVGVSTEKRIIEVDDKGEVFWEYIVPVSDGMRLTQGDDPELSDFFFNVTEYARDYPAFEDKDVEPKDPIEFNFNLHNCNDVTPVENVITSKTTLRVENGALNLMNLSPDVTEILVWDTTGRLVYSVKPYFSSDQITIDLEVSGLHLVTLVSPKEVETLKAWNL